MLNPHDIDFKALGFRAGLEIHHQLKSKRKLFCRCPAELSTVLQKEPEYTFQRRFRAVMGEMGDYDPGMLVEVEKGYLVTYHADSEHICTYEMDETPPFEPDEEAIDAAFHIAFLFHCRSPVDEIVVNRKQYLDGSITTGFQRTCIVARDGYVEILNGKKIPITNILVEEDAARKIRTEDRARSVYYNLDRLGVPLTEIITDHRAIDTPEELMETARMIGMNLRTTGLVRRGIGAVRQDVNLSIAGGRRVEIKGVQDLSIFPKMCALEVCRQQALIDIASTLAKCSIEKEDIDHTYVDISHLFSDLIDGDSAFAVRIPSFEDILLTEIQPGKDLGFEIFEKCRLITGIQDNELFHSGEIRNDAIRAKHHPEDLFIDQNADLEIRRILVLDHGDAYIASRGPTNRVFHALKKAVERCKLVFDGVPEETRRMLPNGNNEFLRVIHGKERLYPDTDTPPIPYPREKTDTIMTNIGPRPLEMGEKYRTSGLTFHQLSDLIRADQIPLFHRLVIDLEMPASLVYHVIHDVCTHLRRKGFQTSSLNDEVMIRLIEAVYKRNLPRAILFPLLADMCGYPDTEKGRETQMDLVDSAIENQLSVNQIRSIVQGYIKDHSIKGNKLVVEKVVGSIMSEERARIDGKNLVSIVEELL